jgi:3-dehydro-4-phosphotetronate decarboxylase
MIYLNPHGTSLTLEQAIDELVSAGREIDRLGLAWAASGNLSVAAGDFIAITPSGSSLGALEPDSLAIISRDGESASGPKPSKELPLHLALYERLPRSAAVVHLHSPFAVAAACRQPWSAHSAIPPLTPYFVMRVGRVPMIPYARPGSLRLAESFAAVGGTFHAALLQNHGSITAGDDVSAAVGAALELETTARLHLLLGSTATQLDEAAIAELVAEFGADW